MQRHIKFLLSALLISGLSIAHISQISIYGSKPQHDSFAQTTSA